MFSIGEMLSGIRCESIPPHIVAMNAMCLLPTRHALLARGFSLLTPKTILRQLPVLVDRVAVEALAQVVSDAAVCHRTQCARGHLQRLLPHVRLLVQRSNLEHQLQRDLSKKGKNGGGLVREGSHSILVLCAKL